MCCCCPPAITALFCLWVQSGFSKGTVAGALTFFPPDPPLYKFERVDEDGNSLSENDDREEDVNARKKDPKKKKSRNENDDLELKEEVEEKDRSTEQENSPPTSLDDDPQRRDDDGVEITDGAYQAKEGQTKEKVKSPAQQLTERAQELRLRAKKRNARDANDAKNNVKYRLILDPRLAPPRITGGRVEAVKIPTKKGSYCAAIVYRVPEASQTDKTRTIIYSHGNATDIGAMFPLQAILAHSLECNVVSYDYSGYGESGGVAMEANTYTDIMGVYSWTLENVCGGDESRIVLYGQSVGSGPCCYLGRREEGLGGMVLHSPFMSGMRVLTPSRALACLDIYPNIDRVRKAKCPVMIIHGRLDEEVDISHGVTMHQAVPGKYKREPWWVPDRGHNDITEGPGKLAENKLAVSAGDPIDKTSELHVMRIRRIPQVRILDQGSILFNHTSCINSIKHQ
ncbi:serine aminopeptidase, S33 [Nitzschia inconspicua]|uniref:Serine aminopeptidase, S33 n=1 Tax=Nitzschia inconspicua TaxID=303405 RepID=A0A9K3KQW3_9STRA|nr:serine aminopeptidase, S33 [Nitzschia inconspicua]